MLTVDGGRGFLNETVLLAIFLHYVKSKLPLISLCIVTNFNKVTPLPIFYTFHFQEADYEYQAQHELYLNYSNCCL